MSPAGRRRFGRSGRPAPFVGCSNRGWARPAPASPATPAADAVPDRGSRRVRDAAPPTARPILTRSGTGIEGFEIEYLAADFERADRVMQDGFGDFATIRYRGASNHTLRVWPFGSWLAEDDRLHVFYAMPRNGERPGGCQVFETESMVSCRSRSRTGAEPKRWSEASSPPTRPFSSASRLAIAASSTTPTTAPDHTGPTCEASAGPVLSPGDGSRVIRGGALASHESINRADSQECSDREKQLTAGFEDVFARITRFGHAGCRSLTRTATRRPALFARSTHDGQI